MGDAHNILHEREPLLRDDSFNREVPKKLLPSAPVDRFYFVYSLFFLLGIGSLLPWNFFSNAKQYFLYKLRNTNISGSESWTNTSLYTSDQVMFETYLELATQIPCVLFVFVNMTLTKTVSARLRILFSISLMIVLFSLTIGFTKVDSDRWQHSFLVLSLVSVILMNVGSAVLQGAVCGLASMFPKIYMQAVFSGMGFGGLAASLASLATIGIGSNPVNSGFAFFLIAELILVSCLVGYLAMSCTLFVKFYTNVVVISVHVSDDDFDGGTRLVSPEVLPVQVGTFRTIVSVAKKIWMPGSSILSVFLVSLACYPAVMSAIESYSGDEVWAKVYFTPVTCFVLFNLTDFIGRNLAGFIQVPKDASPCFLIACLMRVIFIPLFLLCNIQPRHHPYVFFKSDVFPIILSCLFGLSNGYMGTLSMVHTPRLVPEADVEMAGSMMAFFLSLGLGIGALLSALLVNVV